MSRCHGDSTSWRSTCVTVKDDWRLTVGLKLILLIAVELAVSIWIFSVSEKVDAFMMIKLKIFSTGVWEQSWLVFVTQENYLFFQELIRKHYPRGEYYCLAWFSEGYWYSERICRICCHFAAFEVPEFTFCMKMSTWKVNLPQTP